MSDENYLRIQGLWIERIGNQTHIYGVGEGSHINNCSLWGADQNTAIELLGPGHESRTDAPLVLHEDEAPVRGSRPEA